MKPYASITLTLIGAGALGARGKSKNDASTTPIDSASAGSLEGPRHKGAMMDSASMPGIGAMESRMMDSMQTHVRAMEAMSPDRMKALIPMHRQMVASMVSAFDDSMRQMNMPADAAWTALRDSISQWVRIPPGRVLFPGLSHPLPGDPPY